MVAVGAGRMGRGITHMFADAGYPVTLLDIKNRDAGSFQILEREVNSEIDPRRYPRHSNDVSRRQRGGD